VVVSKLDDLRAEIASDPSNDWAVDLGYAPVYAAAPGARIAVVGQAPGRKAQESGVPWDDASGIKLRSWLGLTDEQFYDPNLVALLPMDFYYPGKGPSGDLPPRKEFAPRWHPRLLDLLPHVTLTVLIGGYAQRFYLGPRAKLTLTETVRNYRDYLPAQIPVVHPSPLNFRWQGRNPWFEIDVLPELQALVRAAVA
jgi:uracil-DNA glycosylase